MSSASSTSGGVPSHSLQEDGVTTNASGGGNHVTTSGNIVTSSDPSTNPDASVSEKLKGDFKGAVHGTVGSMQATAGAAIRNEDMQQKGLDKMSEEDQRLGAKHGVMPVGSDKRDTVGK